VVGSPADGLERRGRSLTRPATAGAAQHRADRGHRSETLHIDEHGVTEQLDRSGGVERRKGDAHQSEVAGQVYGRVVEPIHLDARQLVAALKHELWR